MQFFNSWFNLIVIAVFGFFAFRFLIFGSLRGAFYGSRVSRKVGEIDIRQRAGSTTTLRVFQLADGSIVLEKSSHVLFGAPSQAFGINRDSAIKLVALLKEATNA
jgi:hypothetical protein